MSAILGILRFDGARASEHDLERISNALALRGPDARRFLVQGSVGLGHCLLRVNHEDMFERQPLRDVEADLTLVADCRIDNREELAADLQIPAQQLRDMPDSALLLRAYKQWGEACAERLLGDFAFALWDGRAGKLVLARDHMGQRTIQYHRGKDFFAFASSFKGLMALPDVPQRLSMERVAAGLIGAARLNHVPGATAFDGIEGLPGATVMTIGASGEVAARRYWEPRPDPAHENRDKAYYVAAYRRVLGEAVSCRIRRLLHPPGLLLSGGYDSAAIAGLAGPALAGSGRKLVAVASVMPADYRGTIRHARRWVEMCARDMPHLDVRYYAREDLDLLAGMERGFAESGLFVGPYGVVTNAMIGIAARAGARLIMDGHGGDYTLNPRGGGLLAHLLKSGHVRLFLAELRAHRRLAEERWRATVINELAFPLLPRLMTALRRMKRGGKPSLPYGAVNQAWTGELAEPGNLGADNAPLQSADPLERLRFIQRKIMDGATAGGAERASAHGAEVSRPFHDKRVVELALAIPPRLHLNSGRSRALARAALQDVYPPEFQTRWRKNDDEIPDFQMRVKTIEPQLLAEIARMERSDELCRYIDFARIRDLLAARRADDHNSGWEQETHRAMQAFTLARYLDRMWRRNT
ncbi:MAG TPA: asparagine synthase-related protein [Pseudolabrys sp.]|nr:asparagine synthase-related protein [Pseudolabrys sp.]